MSQKANYFRLGVFIVVAVAMFVAIVLALSAGQLFKHTVTLETYFNESVQGLDVGSAVKYRGVQLGRVTRIGLAAPKYEQEVPWSKRKQYVYVEAELRTDAVGARVEQDPKRLEEAVAGGLRIRLAPVGITGTAYLEIDILDPRANPPLEISWTPQNYYIPSAPSTYNQIVRGTQSFLATLDQAHVDDLLKDIAALARTANQKLAEIPAGAIGRDLSDAARDARVLVARLNKFTDSPELQAALRDLSAASARLREALATPAWSTAPTAAYDAFAAVKALAENKHLTDALVHLDRTLTRLDALTAASNADITTAISNHRRSSENLRDLTETAKRYPAYLFSKPPEPMTLVPR